MVLGRSTMVSQRSSMVLRRSIMVLGRSNMVLGRSTMVSGRSTMVLRRSTMVLGRSTMVLGNSGSKGAWRISSGERDKQTTRRTNHYANIEPSDFLVKRWTRENWQIWSSAINIHTPIDIIILFPCSFLNLLQGAQLDNICFNNLNYL